MVKTFRTIVIALSCLAGLWAIHLYLNSPNVIMKRLVATCSKGKDWGRLFDRIDPDDKSSNDWTHARFESFLNTVRGDEWEFVNFTFTEIVPESSPTEPGMPPPFTWNRRNERNYNLFVAQYSTTNPVPIGSIKLRRHLDGKWYFMSAQVIGLVAKANNASPKVRYERYIKAMKATGMDELWKVRPAEKLSVESIEIALSSSGSTPLTFTPSP